MPQSPEADGSDEEHFLPELRSLENLLNGSSSIDYKFLVNGCIGEVWFRRTATLFGMLSMSLRDAFARKVTPKIAANPIDVAICDETCRHPAATYVPQKTAIHIPLELGERLRKYIFDKKPQFYWLEHPDVKMIHEQVGKALHHQATPKVYEPKPRNSPEDIDSATLSTCIGRLARNAKGTPAILPEKWTNVSSWMRNYMRTFKTQNPDNILQNAQRRKDHYALRNGLGFHLANYLLSTSPKQLDEADWGDGGDCNWTSVVRLILPAQTLAHAGYLLKEKANGFPDCEENLWMLRKSYYFMTGDYIESVGKYIRSRKPGTFQIRD